ncbi:MAG TPA: hypothetical protein IAC09_04905 [Candidatus Cryptobacteroides intestinipullorum]|nr:hypothetical protein [Candidatus Cryptobacteroides intestinipullorum]
MRKLSFLSSVLSVSALLFALGSCTEGNIDNGDNTGGDQTPGEPVVYKVGDPYVVNGNTVGIVYEVDETGTHGKAYSLTVYNLSDKYFCKKPGYYTPSPVLPDILPPILNASKFEDAAVPTSLEDGQANCQKMKNEPDWTNKLIALKWVEDLAASQGVAWYIPAIDELKDLVEYMSNAKFEVFKEEIKDNETGEVIMTNEYEWINSENSADVEAAWDAVRDIYKTYTDDKQYLVFHSINVEDDGSVTPVDARTIVEDNFSEPSDLYAYRWYSSSVDQESNKLYTVDMQGQSLYELGYPVVSLLLDATMSDVDKETGASVDNFDIQAGSIHPICKF